MPYDANRNELEILKFWQENKIFEKSVESRPENKPYVFYDGPPFATGLPHYGHILSSVIKDVVPRYWTMKGYRVRRRWGWDCHGLPIENIIEKELKISGKKEIEEKLGVDKFNQACQSKVLIYTREWKKMIDRIGRWIEFDNSYKTMDSTYMESVWWALKTIWNKGLVYEGRKVLMYCPHCETPVSKAEVAMDDSYKDITEEMVVVKFGIMNNELGIRGGEPVYILAWTTTPWTLPGNVALAVGEKINYSLVKIEDEAGYYVLATERLGAVLAGKKYEVKETFSGKSLVGLGYEPLFDIPAIHATSKHAWYVTSADFVTTEEGTGVVHTAVVYGEDDYNLGLKIGLPVVPLLDEKGVFNAEAPDLIRGQYFKDAEKDIKDDLDKRGLLFARENHTHSYPHCWRCDTQLFYNAISAWFINIQKIRERLIKLNEKINWYPGHLKEGRFLNILETAPDWNISRNRYWATPLPFWKCECGQVVCIGSVEELKQKAINFSEIYQTDKVEEIDLHKHLMDKIKLKCDKCGGEMSRVPEVIDCWMESGSMPFAEFHYPFENKKVFEERFPGEYIAEYIAQTRAWFYYMHVMAVLLFDNISFKNVVCTGTILNEKGEKLSKSKMNYTDPWIVIEQYGVDAMRYYLLTSPVMQAENLNFSEAGVKEAYNKTVNILWNVVEFYKTYEERGKRKEERGKRADVLDKWILAKLILLIKEVTENMDNYDIVRAGRPIKDFVDELSTWWLRRSRERFKSGSAEEKSQALSTLYFVLSTLSKVIAPFMPFMAERIYRELGIRNNESGETSVHLQEWPGLHYVAPGKPEEKLLQEMQVARKVVEMGLALRAEAGIRVRQPLQKFTIYNLQFTNNFQLSNDLKNIIADELNVKIVEVLIEKESKLVHNARELSGEGNREYNFLKVFLDTEITPGLRKEGLVRELVRAINQMRKEQKLTIKDKIVVEYQTEDEELEQVFLDFAEELKKSVLASGIRLAVDGEEKEIDGRKIRIRLVCG